MTTKRAKKKNRRVFRSMKEFRKHYLPNAYEKEQMEEKNKDPKSLGASMAQDYLERVRRELEKQK